MQYKTREIKTSADKKLSKKFESSYCSGNLFHSLQFTGTYVRKLHCLLGLSISEFLKLAGHFNTTGKLDVLFFKKRVAIIKLHFFKFLLDMHLISLDKCLVGSLEGQINFLILES